MQPGIQSSYRTLFKPLLQASQRPGWELCIALSPTVPEADVSLNPAFSTPLLYFCPFLLSNPFRLTLFPAFAAPRPSSRQPSSSDRGQRSSLDGLLWDKSLLLKIQQPLIHIFVKTVNGVNSGLGLTSSQMLLKVPQTWISLAVLLNKNQLGQKKNQAEFCLCHNSEVARTTKGNTRTHRNATNAVVG